MIPKMFYVAWESDIFVLFLIINNNVFLLVHVYYITSCVIGNLVDVELIKRQADSEWRAAEV